LSRY